MQHALKAETTRSRLAARRPRSSFPTTTRGLCLVCVERSGQVAHFSARCELPDHWVRTSEFGVQLEGDRRIYPPQVLPSGGHRRTYGWTELSLATISTRKYFGINHPPTARLGSFKGPLQSDRPIVLSENDLERPGRQTTPQPSEHITNPRRDRHCFRP